MRGLLAILAALLLSGCATVAPNPAIIWAEPDPWWAAWQHAERIHGMAYRAIGTSMEPFIFEGDFEVVDFSFKWVDLRAGMIPVYDPNWADASVPLVSHMAVERTGAGWIVRGINNQYSESGKYAMMEADFRGVVIAVYTSRKNP